MAEQQLPITESGASTVKVRVNVGRLRRNRSLVLLVFSAIVLLGILYGLTYWGYHSSRLPYSFDNLVQRTGMWRLYGSKSYEPVSVGDDFDLVDPRLEGVVEGSVVSYVVQGAAVSFGKTGSAVSDIELLLPSGDSTKIPGTYEVERVLTIQNGVDATYVGEVYAPGMLEDLTQGSQVRIEFQRVYGEEWKISELLFIDTEWVQETSPSTVPQTDPFLEEIHF